MAQKQPDITVYFLQSTRSIRPVWLLEELEIPYKIEAKPYRQDPADRKAFNELSGSPMGKYPTVRVGDLVLHESGAITEYFCDHYDTQHRLIPTDPVRRARTQIFIHAAEGTIAMHAIAAFYFRSFTPAECRQNSAEAVGGAEAKLSGIVAKDLDWLESELEQSAGPFLVGDTVTAADIMVLYSVQLISKLKFAGEGKSWPKIEAWIQACEETASYKRAVERSGFVL